MAAFDTKGRELAKTKSGYKYKFAAALFAIACSDSGATQQSKSGDGSAGFSGSGTADSGRGTGGSAGLSGGGTGAASAGGSGGAGGSKTGCPTGLPGPALVEVLAPAGSAAATYCIDATEVTNADYAAFVSSKGSDTSGQDSWCTWNTTYGPTLPATASAFPVVWVDWCDAYAYCKWAGKHLCGKIGGGANLFADYDLAGASEWYNACSAGGTQAYPYGNTYDGAACVGDDYDGAPGYQPSSDAAHPVGSAARCHGTTSAFAGIHDLSGNVLEWEDSCNGATGSGDECRIRGGSFYGYEPFLACAYDVSDARDFAYDGLGFRCCGAPI